MGQTPSRLLKVQQWASSVLGMRDCITTVAFDTAVMMWGVFCENRLNERNEDHQPIWSLEQLLGEPEEINNEASFRALASLMGGMSI